MMEYVILTQSVDIETGGGYRAAADNLTADVLLYLQGDWRPLGSLACGQVDGRFIVMREMVREGEAESDA